MPRNSDFPDYKGLSVTHAGGIDPQERNRRSFKNADNKSEPKEGLGPVKGMVSPRKRREHNPSKDTIDRTTEAAMKDWRNRGLSNNDIIDY